MSEITERDVSRNDAVTKAGKSDGFGGQAAAAAAAGARRGFFSPYKGTQGKNTRWGTAAGLTVFLAWFAYFLWEKLGLVDAAPNTLKVIQFGIPVAVFLILGLIGYWALGKNQKVVDFLIATEGEMKKVNWTSRKEIIGSTKVVIIVMLMMAVLLFVVDLIFMTFFSWIGVLEGGGGIIEVVKGLL